MRPDPLILAFDTSAAHCAAALVSGDSILARHAEDMVRGQAEALFPMLDALMTGAKVDWKDLTAIGVGTGPGNFTGIRIAVAAARGLSMSLGIPAIGVTGFEALTFGQTASVWATISAPRDHVYVKLEPGDEQARLFPVEEAREAIARSAHPAMGTLGDPPILRPDPVVIAHCASTRLASGAAIAAPAPTYIRPPDAAPSRDAPPVILA